MTTSTKRPDGGEHDIDANNAEADRQIASDVLGWLQARGLYDPRDYECEGPDVAELLTEHEQNIAPQAKGGEPAPWSEDEEDAERLLACASRRKKYGDENCECDEDGSCVECEYDMQDVLKKRYAPLKHIATPAPQPPVEGLRELADKLENLPLSDEKNVLVLEQAANALRSLAPAPTDIDANNAEADRQIANDVLGWLKARGLYDPRDYECEGPDVAELLTEHEANMERPLASPSLTAGEIAGWQWKIPGGEYGWTPCSPPDENDLRDYPGSFRPVYAGAIVK